MKIMLFCNKEISGPFTIPSGIVTTEISVLERIANEIPEIGILTTKSIGIKSIPGNREPIIAQYDSFSFINAVGLTNKGATYFAKELKKIKIPDNKFLLCSIFGSNEEEFHKIAEKLFEVCDGFELNLSCPHSEKLNIYSSVDFMTRCGIGLCGSCASPSGYRSCVDGPFLKSEISL